ncbi:CynX/NimT family MFS transporter [Vreelandella jeotgali]|uniref:CynX/NimT family MFS transporter n=1 Tax=Vreelandella jeotgali TaxID=553386 RepID=UPI00034BDDEB|nr:CynX/NimT family MFS transporter [Halomonas jeotgali]
MTAEDNTVSHKTAHTETLQFIGGLLLIMALGLNLRPLLASASPLMDNIRASTGLDYGVLAWLTTLPFLCMGAVALASGRLQRLLGESRGIMLSLVAIGAACALRQVSGTGMTLLSTALLGGAGIALIQALVPGLVKRRFGARMPLVMGLYSASLMSGGGLSAWISPQLAVSGGWQLGVGIWWVPALITLVAWWVIFRRDSAPQRDTAAIDGVRPRRLKRAWLLALYFGVINAGYSSVVTWLPQYYHELGWSELAGGRLLAWMTLFQVLAALVMPSLAQRQGTADRRGLLAVALTAQLVGYLGFIFMPQSLALVWNAVGGFGLGACFSLGLILALDHLRDARAAGRLAAFMQGFGFMLNAMSPWISGTLRDMTGSFIPAWALLAAGIVAMLLITLRFKPARYPQVMQEAG